MEHTYFFAVDLGATSGRTILGCLGEGKMELKELTRFPNHIIETGGHCYWDISVNLSLKKRKLPT